MRAAKVHGAFQKHGKQFLRGIPRTAAESGAIPDRGCILVGSLELTLALAPALYVSELGKQGRNG